MGQQRRQIPEAVSAGRFDSPVGGAPGDAGRAAREWWWAGRLLALHGFSVQHCPYPTAGAPRWHWLDGFASGTRTVARGAAPPA